MDESITQNETTMMDFIQKIEDVADEVVNKVLEDGVVEAELVLMVSGIEYTFNLHTFATEFQQEIDHKGQPSHEEKGGLLSMTLDECQTDIFNTWALSRSVMKLSGEVVFRNPKAGISPKLRIAFTDAVCIGYQKVVENDGEDIFLKLLLSPRSMMFGAVDHKNGEWKNT